jgi:hypothetical protein
MVQLNAEQRRENADALCKLQMLAGMEKKVRTLEYREDLG